MVVANSCPYGFSRQIGVDVPNLNRVGNENVVVVGKHSFKCVSIVLIITVVIADEDLVAGLRDLHIAGRHGSISPLCGCNLLPGRCTGGNESTPYAVGKNRSIPYSLIAWLDLYLPMSLEGLASYAQP